MKKLLDDLCFHDATIDSIVIESRKSHFDTLIVRLTSKQFNPILQTPNIELQFFDCYSAMLDLNMWIVGFDSVSSFSLNSDPETVEQLEIKRRKENGTLWETSMFYQFELILNTSGSKIVILCKDYDITPV